MSAESMLPWTVDGRYDISGEGDLRDFIMTAGKDPYENWKPMLDIQKPFLRDNSHAKSLIDALEKI